MQSPCSPSFCAKHQHARAKQQHSEPAAGAELFAHRSYADQCRDERRGAAHQRIRIAQLAMSVDQSEQLEVHELEQDRRDQIGPRDGRRQGDEGQREARNERRRDRYEKHLCALIRRRLDDDIPSRMQRSRAEQERIRPSDIAAHTDRMAIAL